MTRSEPSGTVPIAFYGNLEKSPLSLGPKPSSIHILALTPKILAEQSSLLLEHLQAGSHIRLLLTGGLSALTWRDVRRTVSDYFTALEDFRKKLRRAGCDHRFEVKEQDWTPSVGMLQVGEGEIGSVCYVSIYTPDPRSSRAGKTVLKLSADTTTELFQFYAGQFLSLWRVARSFDPNPAFRVRSIRQAAVNRFRSILDKTSEVEIAFIVALREEFDELQEIVGGFSSKRDAETGQYTYHFEIAKRRCVAILVGTMGHTAVAQLVERLIAHFAVQTLISIGIAGALSRAVQVLDVVVASQVNSYLENAKAEGNSRSDRFSLQLGGQAARTTHQFQDEALHLRYAHASAWESWRDACRAEAQKVLGDIHIPSPRFPAASALFEQLVEGKATLSSMDAADRHPRIRLAPELHANDAHVASGPVVGADQQFTRWLKQFGDRKVLGIEMEAGGVMTAAHWRSQPLRTLVVRAISDLADEEKNVLEDLFGTSLRRVAMRNAVLLVKCMLEADLLKGLPESVESA